MWLFFKLDSSVEVNVKTAFVHSVIQWRRLANILQIIIYNKGLVIKTHIIPKGCI